MVNGKKYLHYKLLRILQENTDRNHPVKQQELVTALKEDFPALNRCTVRRALSDLISDPQSRVHYLNEERDFASDEDKQPYYTDIYYDQEFSDAELRLLIDGILFSRNVPHKERNELIAKRCALGNKFFQWRMENINRLAKDEPMNPQLFTSIGILDRAIQKKKQVRLIYNYMGPDFELEPHATRHGISQLINPYSIVARNGYYFLVCNNDIYEDVTNYRIDRMTQVEIQDTPVKPVRSVRGLENGLNIQEYMAANINMAYGKPHLITFEATKKGITEAIDAFGKNIQIQRTDGSTYLCTVRTPYYDMERWAIQNWNDVTILSPQELVENMRANAQKVLEKHSS